MEIDESSEKSWNFVLVHNIFEQSLLPACCPLLLQQPHQSVPKFYRDICLHETANGCAIEEFGRSEFLDALIALLKTLSAYVR